MRYVGIIFPLVSFFKEHILRSGHGKVPRTSSVLGRALVLLAQLDVSNSGRGRRIRKPSDKALAAAQANLADSSSDEASDAEGRPATRQVTSRNKARKRRAEVLVCACWRSPDALQSASSGADIDSDERRSADSPAARTTAHRVSPAAEKLSAIGLQGFAAAAPLREGKSVRISASLHRVDLAC